MKRMLMTVLLLVATLGLGHVHPSVRAAVEAQLGRVWHVSNHYWNEPSIALADSAACCGRRGSSRGIQRGSYSLRFGGSLVVGLLVGFGHAIVSLFMVYL